MIATEKKIRCPRVATIFKDAWDKGNLSVESIQKYLEMFNASLSRCNNANISDDIRLSEEGKYDSTHTLPVAPPITIISNQDSTNESLSSFPSPSDEAEFSLGNLPKVLTSDSFVIGEVANEDKDKVRVDGGGEMPDLFSDDTSEMTVETSSTPRGHSWDSCLSGVDSVPDAAADESDFSEQNYIRLEGISEEELTKEVGRLMDSIAEEQRKEKRNSGVHSDGDVHFDNYHCYYTDFYSGCTKIPLELDVRGDSESDMENLNYDEGKRKSHSSYNAAYVTDVIAVIPMEDIDLISELDDLWKQLFPLAVSNTTSTSTDVDKNLEYKYNNTTQKVFLEAQEGIYRYEPPPLTEMDLWWMQRDKKVADSAISVVRSVLGACGLDLKKRQTETNSSTNEMFQAFPQKTCVCPANRRYRNISFEVVKLGYYASDELMAKKKQDFIMSSKGAYLLYRMGQFLGAIGIEGAQTALCDYNLLTSTESCFPRNNNRRPGKLNLSNYL
eukprot:Tbor_TRINITY_DN4987_c3_g1::TRINITY_DN4987_c3_g1_i1::g.9805::m.9805